MNVFILVMVLLADVPELPDTKRAARRKARARTIAHNRRIYHDLVGSGMWFECPDENGHYGRWASGHDHKKKQEGRWVTKQLSGHRRFQKWSRDYYPSLTDEKARLRWDDELRDYLG